MCLVWLFFFFKQKTAYEMRISDWSSDVCSSDLLLADCRGLRDIADRKLVDALTGLLDWPARQLLEKLAPAEYASPAGSRHPIDYGAEGGPTVDRKSVV